MHIPLNALNILLIEDDAEDRDWIIELLQAMGVERIKISEAASYEEAMALLAAKKANCLIVDLGLQDGSFEGIKLLEEDLATGIYKIVLTKFTEQLQHALLRGARRFLTKQQVAEEPEALREALIDAALQLSNDEKVVFQSKAMVRLFQEVAIAAKLDGPILILGQSGTGKEIVARSLHAFSSRSVFPFEPINCAALQYEGARTEFFGVAADAFTGVKARSGVFERAHRGDVFLDEIGDLRQEDQGLLLRILERPDELRPIGGDPVRVNGEVCDFRVICATNKPIHEMSEGNTFRRDLWARLSECVLRVPPLDDRAEDIPLLVRLYLKSRRIEPGRLTKGALDELHATSWTDENVRGLWNVVGRALVCSEIRSTSSHAPVTAEDIKEALDVLRRDRKKPQGSFSALFDGTASMRDVEKAYISRVLQRTEWNISEAAQILGLGRNTLYGKMKRYSIRPPKEGE